MPGANEPPLLNYHPNRTIVRKNNRLNRLLYWLPRQGDAARRGAAFGFATSIAVSIILLLLVAAGLDFAKDYIVAVILILPFCGMLIGSVVAQAACLREWAVPRGIVKFGLATFILGGIGFGLPAAVGANVFQLPIASILITLGILVAAAILSQR